MKEELQGKLVEILTSIQTAAGKASDFAMAELPDIAQSYVVYGRAWATLDAALFLALLPLAVFLAGRAADRHFQESDAGYPGGLFMVCGGVIAGFIFLIGTNDLKDLFLVWFAPKVWLLKEIAALVK